MLKNTYIRCVRTAAKVGERTGLLSALERHRERRSALWLRSLFSIYRLDDLVRLDLAWWTFEAMDLVEAFLGEKPGARVFEYGSGASTFWLARRGAIVTSIEHDAEWGATMLDRTQGHENIHVRIVPPTKSPEGKFSSGVRGWRGYDFEEYVRSIDSEVGTFDLIVIDGRCRPACLAQSKARLSEGGVILFDNSGRSRYRTAIDSAGMNQLVTCGLVPTLPYPDETTLLRWEVVDPELGSDAGPGQKVR